MESVFYFRQNLKKLSNEDKRVLFLLFKHSAKLYNESLYLINKNFEKTGKYTKYTDVNDYLSHTIESNNQNRSINYQLLGHSLSLSIIRNLDINFKNFFNNQKKEGNLERPLFRNKNFFIALFSSTYQIKENELIIPLTKKFRDKYNISNDYRLKFNISKQAKKLSFNQIRLHQINNEYYLVYHFKKEIISKKSDNKNYLSIDFGVDNLFSCYSYINDNNNLRPFIIKGKPLKFINHKTFLFNKLQYNRNNNINSSKITKKFNQRNNQIDNYLNKSIKYILEYCLLNNINTIVCGFFKNIKLRLVSKSFYYIPYLKIRRKFRDMCNKYGINCFFINESYTSKTSFLDYESATKQTDYEGNRVKRGMFKTKNGKKINADINGAAQILTKFCNFKIENRENILLTPKVIKIK